MENFKYAEEYLILPDTVQPTYMKITWMQRPF